MTAHFFPPMHSKSLKEQAYELLRSAIISGRLDPGRLYNETGLAHRLGVSRTPVREALLELSREGMVIFVPRKGIKIRKITHKDVSDVMELRQMIEGYLIEHCASNLAPKDLERLSKIIDKQKAMFKKDDREAYLKADRAFHDYFVAKLGNKQLQLVMYNLRDLIHFMGIKAVAQYGRLQKVTEEHEQILTALNTNDPSAAKAAMSNHLTNTEKILLNAIDMDRDQHQEDG